MIKYTYIILAILITVQINAQVDSAKVYWVGHSLISHTDSYSPGTDNLIVQLGVMATAESKTYDHYQHTTPGAPLGWNWGANADAWASSEALIQPLINTSNPNYGTYDVMVITEGVNLEAVYEWWWSDFYSRKFFNAAKNANSDTRLFMYESWHHFHASDDEVRYYYGPMSTFDWEQYMLDVRPIWEEIIDFASDPALTVTDPSYVFQGTGSDPGNGSDILDIKIIPTGQVLVSVLERLEQDLAGDDWDYDGSDLESIDFFANPLSNFPADTVTTVHPADPIDDIHPSNVQIYLNSLVHYTCIYQEDPVNIPPSNGVPANIADIFKEVVWDVVTNDPRTGVSAPLAVNYIEPLNSELISDKIKLSWTLGSVSEAENIIVQKSNNGYQWNNWNNVKPQNNIETQYHLWDDSPTPGMNYYRVKTIDLNNYIQYSNVTVSNYNTNDIHFYPNPNCGTINIKDPNKIITEIQLVDAKGQVIFNCHPSNIEGVNLSTLPTNTYWLNYKVGTETIKSEPLIINP